MNVNAKRKRGKDVQGNKNNGIFTKYHFSHQRNTIFVFIRTAK